MARLCTNLVKRAVLEQCSVATPTYAFFVESLQFYSIAFVSSKKQVLSPPIFDNFDIS
jgi:hypothetical protein